jgi:hypothetical protein
MLNIAIALLVTGLFFLPLIENRNVAPVAHHN